MKTKIFGAILLGSVLAMGLSSVVAQNTFTHDMKSAGRNTKQAGKDTGHAVEHGTKKTYHATKRGTRKTAHYTARKTDEGARHVEGKTEPR